MQMRFIQTAGIYTLIIWPATAFSQEMTNENFFNDQMGMTIDDLLPDTAIADESIDAPTNAIVSDVISPDTSKSFIPIFIDLSDFRGDQVYDLFDHWSKFLSGSTGINVGYPEAVMVDKNSAKFVLGTIQYMRDNGLNYASNPLYETLSRDEDRIISDYAWDGFMSILNDVGRENHKPDGDASNQLITKKYVNAISPSDDTTSDFLKQISKAIYLTCNGNLRFLPPHDIIITSDMDTHKIIAQILTIRTKMFSHKGGIPNDSSLIIIKNQEEEILKLLLSCIGIKADRAINTPGNSQSYLLGNIDMAKDIMRLHQFIIGILSKKQGRNRQSR